MGNENWSSYMRVVGDGCGWADAEGAVEVRKKLCHYSVNYMLAL